MLPLWRRWRIPLARTLIVAFLIVMYLIYAPRFLSLHPVAHELLAIRYIQTIHQAETQYRSQFGRYAETLAELGQPAGGPASASASDLIDPDLARGRKGGYKLTLTGNAGGYILTAVPIKLGSTGNQTFYSDQTMVIRRSFTSEPATAASSEMK